MRHLTAAHGLADQVHLESAGTGDWHVGENADPRSRAAGKKRGYALDRRARHFQAHLFDSYDYLLVADGANFRHLVSIAPDETARAKIRLLRDFDPASPAGSDVPDPYYGGPEGFEAVLDICEAACRGLLAHVQELSTKR